MNHIFRSLHASRSLVAFSWQKFAFSSYAPRLSSFEQRWVKLSQAEKEQIAVEYESFQKADWKNLTIDQKKIRKNGVIEDFFNLIKNAFFLFAK
jgi:hypothetical protein